MRSLLVVLCFLCAMSCSKKSDSQSESKATSEQSSHQPADQVKIDGAAQQVAGITVQKVALRTMSQRLVAAGQIVLDEERTAHVGTYTDGRVRSVYASVGEWVRKGTILTRMHSHDVHDTRAAYESALAEVQHQENNVQFATRTRDRMRRLYQLTFASQQEVEKAETDLQAAETGLEDARISVRKEEAHLTDILALPASALRNLNETTELVPVVAPMSGTVIDRKVTPGSVVEPGQEVFTLSDLSTVWMIASVNETDIAKLKTGRCASVLTQAFPNEAFAGRVERLGTELDPQTRTLQVRIVLPNPGMKLRPQMYANAQIDEGESTQAIFLPEEAIQDINGSATVFVRSNGDTFRAQAVQIAHRLNGEAEIAAGLKPGEEVAVKGSFVVKSDMLKNQIGE
jgi:cobalt-zinc-cadmium efflux system membrane fusion protein